MFFSTCSRCCFSISSRDFHLWEYSYSNVPCWAKRGGVSLSLTIFKYEPIYRCTREIYLISPKNTSPFTGLLLLRITEKYRSPWFLRYFYSKNNTCCRTTQSTVTWALTIKSYLPHFLTHFPSQILIQEIFFQPLNMKILGFPSGVEIKNPPANAGETGSSTGPGRSHMPQSN